MATDPQTLAAVGALEEALTSLSAALETLKQPEAGEQAIKVALVKCNAVIEHTYDAKKMLDLQRNRHLLFFEKP